MIPESPHNFPYRRWTLEDSSLAILVGATATFVGAVAFLVTVGDGNRRRAVVAAVEATGAATAVFLLLVFVATVALPASVALVALITGAAAHLAFRRDLGRRRAVLRP
ncbi:hypothetical protein HCA58_10865 [Micromonospora sp. HNM0581]|uniref:hypothetical protein n=1 Tax=Micromonospora sp. HNM0581 TaxID=2716341 RepID=UPI00146E8397|nr:hypothetical protein [Micromonospora sp. HNM0581]NLU78872.1 hypothetical protein [Micromonospora sp. HNM0581]